MNEIYKKTSLVWSKQQDCFHIETLAKTIEIGLYGYKDKSRFTDYILIGVFDSHEEASEACKKLREVVE